MTEERLLLYRNVQPCSPNLFLCKLNENVVTNKGKQKIPSDMLLQSYQYLTFQKMLDL